MFGFKDHMGAVALAICERRCPDLMGGRLQLRADRNNFYSLRIYICIRVYRREGEIPDVDDV